MKLVNIINMEVIAEVTTNHRMSIEDAVAIMGGEIYDDKDIWDENVLIDDEWYFYDDLELMTNERYDELLAANK